MKIWILVWRLNPPHFWHLNIIETMLKENSKTLVFLGSSNILDEKNPFSFEERKDFLLEIFEKEENLFIDFLEDFEHDEEWILSLKNKISSIILKNSYPLPTKIGDYSSNVSDNFEIIFYGWDLKNDYAIQIIKDFEKLLDFPQIFYKEISRKESFLLINWEKVDISSTNLRIFLKTENKNILEKFTDEKILKKIIV